MTPRPKSEEKKIKIIEAAINTFSKHGLEKGTISTIAKEAGIGKGTVYQYFQSKEEIFEQIIYVVFDEMFSAWKQLIKINISPKEKIEKMIDFSIDATIQMINSENREQFTMLMEIFLYAVRNNEKIHLEKTLQNLYKIITPLINEGIEKNIFKDIDIEYIGFILFSFLDGLGMHLYFQQKNYDQKKLTKIIKDLIFAGLLK